MKNLEALIRAKAMELGFAAAGITPVSLSRTFEKFKEWLSGGMHAGMEYMQKHAALREDPRHVMPAARSVIVVAARYPVNRHPGAGFSTYACGRDYHEVVREKLKMLASFLQAEAHCKACRICVDSAPVLEREVAVSAGVGWRGRQGQIVNPAAGCCLVLGELFVDLDLKGNKVIENQCAECRRCLDACPTGALREDGLVDARKCISYLTIEHKGEIAPELRRKMGQAVFGCDLCTAVCPWNKFGEDLVMPEFIEAEMPSAGEIAEMTDATFKKRFRYTAVHRSGLERLKRNAGIAIENGSI